MCEDGPTTWTLTNAHVTATDGACISLSRFAFAFRLPRLNMSMTANNGDFDQTLSGLHGLLIRPSEAQ